jgi:hypothetical protein
MVVDYKSGGAGAVRLQIPLYMGALPKSAGGYYLNLRDFSKRHVSTDEIAPALQIATGIIGELKCGKIDQSALNKTICAYCPIGAMCGGRQ